MGLPGLDLLLIGLLVIGVGLIIWSANPMRALIGTVLIMLTVQLLRSILFTGSPHLSWEQWSASVLTGAITWLIARLVRPSRRRAAQQTRSLQR